MRPLQAMQVAERARVVLVARVFLVREHHDTRRDEAGDVVDVSVRVVTHAPFAQPDGVGDAQILAKGALVVAAAGADPEPADDAQHAL